MQSSTSYRAISKNISTLGMLLMMKNQFHNHALYNAVKILLQIPSRKIEVRSSILPF